MTKIEPTPESFWKSEQMTEAIYRFLGYLPPAQPEPPADEADEETEGDHATA